MTTPLAWTATKNIPTSPAVERHLKGAQIPPPWGISSHQFGEVLRHGKHDIHV